MDPELFANQILGQIKTQIMFMLNEVADEFDERELTDDQRRIYNDFTASFGQKVLQLRITNDRRTNATPEQPGTAAPSRENSTDKSR